MTILLNACAISDPNAALENKVPLFRKAVAAMWKIKPNQVPISWTMDEDHLVPVLFKQSPDASAPITCVFDENMKKVVACWEEANLKA